MIPTRVTKKSNITIHFSLNLADMTPVDGTEPDEPMTFTLGDGTMIQAFEDAILGMSENEQRQVRLPPRETFGFPEESNFHWMEKDKFVDLDIKDIQPGLIFEFDTPAGDKIPGTIREIEDQRILIDFNHPLAGHELIFAVNLVSINHA